MAWKGISERRMTVYPTGEFYLLALPLQVDQFQRIDGVSLPQIDVVDVTAELGFWGALNLPVLSLCSSLLLCLKISSFNRIILGTDRDSSLGQNQVVGYSSFCFLFFSLLPLSTLSCRHS